MSSAHFRLEPFRPWIPSQDKAHLGRKRLDLCRYPSPVSISATSSSPHQKSPVSQNQNINAPGPEQHPLPARPPTEVCLNSSPKLDSQSTRSEREVFALPSSADPEPGISSGFPDSVFSDCVPNFLDVDLPMPFDDIVHDPGHQFSRFSSSDLELASTMDQHSQPIPTGDSCDATIDPTILYDHHPRDAGQTPAREVIPGNATSTGGSPVEYTHSPHEDTHFDRVQENPPNGLKPGWRPSKINKVSVVVDNRAKKGAGRFTQRDVGRRSFPSLRAQFSALSVEDRVQFLSWLFEGALSHSLHTPSSTIDESAARCMPRQGGITTNKSIAGGVNTKRIHSSRNRLSWSIEQDRLLVQLREEESLSWSELTKRFSQKFPGRKQGSIQGRWSKVLSKQRLSVKGS